MTETTETAVTSFIRQADILDPDVASAAHVTVIGCGTVGSHAAVELARMGVGSMTVIDGDEVEAHNLPSQAFHLSDVGRGKAEALADRIADVSDAKVKWEKKYLSGGEVFPDGPIVLAVDDMDARKNILELSIASRPSHSLVIDGRMGGKMWQMLSFDPNDYDKVENWTTNFYFPQSEATPLPCGGRSVSFIGSFIGGMIASYVCRNLNEEETPFFISGDLDSYGCYPM